MSNNYAFRQFEDAIGPLTRKFLIPLTIALVIVHQQVTDVEQTVGT